METKNYVLGGREGWRYKFQLETDYKACSLPTLMVSLPWLTAVSKRGSMVSGPGKPGGGLGVLFSSTVCGAGGGAKRGKLGLTLHVHISCYQGSTLEC